MTKPQWLKTPDFYELQQFSHRHLVPPNGVAVLQCVVNVRGLLEDCQVVTETPPGRGVGDDALALARLYVMRPQLVDGVPVEASVTVPIRFGDVLETPRPDRTIRVSDNMPWSEVPSAAELLAAFPRQAAGKVETGYVVLRCEVWSSGALKDCAVSDEQPIGYGFATAAIGLSKIFRTLDKLRGSPQTRGLYVDVAFNFRDPATPAKSIELSVPQWLRRVDLSSPRLFPDLAAEKGFKSGGAIVACEAAHDGFLNHCTVDSEDPPGVGFGAKAVAIAGLMQVNPWTRQGDPAEGAHVRVPIHLNLHEPAPEPAAPPLPPGK